MKEVLITVDSNDRVVMMKYNVDKNDDLLKDENCFLVPAPTSPPVQEGYFASPRYDRTTKSIVYDYIPRPLTDNERIELLEGTLLELMAQFAEMKGAMKNG